jgi:hypothetical protein
MEMNQNLNHKTPFMNTSAKGTSCNDESFNLKQHLLSFGAGEMELLKRAACDDMDLFNQIYGWIFSGNRRLAWRSCWIIDTASEKQPDLLSDKIPEIISGLSATTDSSLKRHFTRILCRYQIPEIYQVTIINRCFELLVPSEPAAVRVNAMQLLFNLSQHLPDLKIELRSVLESLIDEGGSAGFINRALKLAKQL